MRWKILLKLLYLIVLFAVATYKWDSNAKLIDSDPKVESRDWNHIYHEA